MTSPLIFCILFYCIFLILDVKSQVEGDVKLINGPSSHQGTVIVYHNNAWGTLCDDSWEKKDADVICRQLGFEEAEVVWYQAQYGSGPGEIWVDQIECPINASHILQCSPHVQQWGVHDCSHFEDAGVDCSRKMVTIASLPIALSCPEYHQLGTCQNCTTTVPVDPLDCSQHSTVEGIVTALHEGKWYPVNGQGFGLEEARVVCGRLGFPIALGNPSLEELWTNHDDSFCTGSEMGSGMAPCTELEILENNEYRTSLSQVLLKDLECTSGEADLKYCSFSELGPIPTSGLNVASVRCGFSKQTCSSPPSIPSEKYRLKGSAVPWMGRVEVQTSSGGWATICDNDWDHVDASIVCRALGYGAAKTVFSGANFGRGVGEIIYTELKCNGTEKTLSACKDKRTGSLAQSCGHEHDASVECTRPDVCPDTVIEKKARLLDVPVSTTFNNSFVEVNGPTGWGSICIEHMSWKSANVICRSTRHQFASNVRAGSYTGSVIRYGGILECSGEEMSLSECGIALVQTSSCKDGEAIIDCRPGLPDLVPDLGTTSRSLSRNIYIISRSISQLTCALEEGCLSSSASANSESSRFLLRFDSLTMNWGTADFRPHRSRDDWQFHTCHNHYHSFEAFIHYDLLNSVTGAKVAEGHKASFCLEDSLCEDSGRSYNCRREQGIGVNCGDLYDANLDCQWIDITDVPSGLYDLRLIVNPDYLVPEYDHDNNQLTCRVQITHVASYFWSMRSFGCQISDH